MTDLFKKDAFLWSEVAENSIKKILKETLMNTPVLIHPDFEIEIDACMNGVGTVPIAYHSSKLNGGMLLVSTYAKKMHAITQAGKWRLPLRS